ncbi:glycosyltransferase [Pigmentiphaga sp. D-2]|uniref:glycosyltransferase n=1 Tax=Pigmentiphaga sp. D-2 TaxID=1002116 RepID=UPI0010512785|nr:glycosyltransferase [Pigmentiphaga sp. D-2]
MKNGCQDLRFAFLMCVNRYVPFLDEAIESVLTQDDSDFSFYIIANNCDDSLWEYLHKFKDPRISFHRTQIGQLSFNLNYGLNLIRTGYVLRMDADDISLPNRLSRTKAALSQYDYPDCLGSSAILINDVGKELGVQEVPLSNKSIRASLWKRCPMIHPSCAIRVESVLRMRGYLGGFMSEDYDLWLRAARDPNFIFLNDKLPFIKYRISPLQARGHKLGYAETAGYFLRDALLYGKLRHWLGTGLAIAKRIRNAK